MATATSVDRHEANRTKLRTAWRGWPLERILFALAGVMTGLSAALAALVSPWFLLLTGFVALNLVLFAATGACGASLVLRRLGVRGGCDR